jgi:ABC-2 type transport system permease protein
MSRLLVAEIFKLRKRAMSWILLAIMIGIIILLYFVLLAISNVDINGQRAGNLESLLGLEGAIPFAFALLGSFGSALAVVLMASTVGNEYNWRTIRTMLISSESRTKLLLAKLLAVCLFIVLGLIIGLIAGFIMSIITTAIGGYKYDFSFFTGSYVWNQFVQLWRTFYIMMPYVMLAFLFAIVGRSAMPGIAVGIGVFFLEAIISGLMYTAGGWVSRIPAYLINANFNAIQSLNNLPGRVGSGFGGGTAMASYTPSLMHAAIILGIYIVVFIVVGFLVFRKRDVTS